MGVFLTQATGCAVFGLYPDKHDYEFNAAAASEIPRELAKATLPAYRVEPPDILVVEALNNIRPPADELRAGDELLIRASNTLPIDPEGDTITNEFRVINSIYFVQSDGTVDLGPEYGTVPVEGFTLAAAKSAIIDHLQNTIGLAMPNVAVSMPDVTGKQVISGEHLVRPDGTISLGVYGEVYVAGRTLREIRQIIETHLQQDVHNPEVTVDVLGYNSKQIYIITDGGGLGESVNRIPYTGNDTVLDALSQIDGLSEVSSKEIWVARPAPAGTSLAQTMPVDWWGITRGGLTATNYQLFPGDRIFIRSDHMARFNNTVSKVIAPFERIMGFSLFGHGLVREFQFGHMRGGNRGFGNNNGGFAAP